MSNTQETRAYPRRDESNTVFSKSKRDFPAKSKRRRKYTQKHPRSHKRSYKEGQDSHRSGNNRRRKESAHHSNQCRSNLGSNGHKKSDKYNTRFNKRVVEDFSTDESNGDENVEELSKYQHDFKVQVRGQMVLNTTDPRKAYRKYRSRTKYAACSKLKPPEPQKIAIPTLL